MSHVKVRYSKAGIMQYFDFKTNEDNTKILSTDFYCRYVKNDAENFPIFKVGESIKSVLKKVAKFSYDKKSEIWAIDGILFNCNDKKDINNKYINEINLIYKKFLENEILPEIPEGYKFQWGSIVYEEDYLSDIEKYSKIYNKVNYLCYRFLYALRVVKHNSFDCETRYIEDYLNIVVSRADL